MGHLLPALLLAGLAPADGAPDVVMTKPSPGRSTDQPRPRDGNVAIQEELDAARTVRTLAAYDRFLARHPDHPLAEIARREREQLSR